MSRPPKNPERLAEMILSEAPSTPNKGSVRALGAAILALLLKVLGREAPPPDRGRRLTRTAFKRKGQTVHVLDLETKETFKVKASNAPEARAFVHALTLGALHAPKMSARSVAEAARLAVHHATGQEA